MTQREVSHETPLPRCRADHMARHMLDERRPQSGGGHFIECRCGRTQKHPEFGPALAEWKRQNGIRTPRPAAPAANVVQLGLRFKGGTAT